MDNTTENSSDAEATSALLLERRLETMAGTKKTADVIDFDALLEELGELGRFQIITYILVCVPVLFAAANSLSYVFVAGVPNYRCVVPNCDNETHPEYQQSWISHAIPSTSQSHYKPAQCVMYEQVDLNESKVQDNNTCPKNWFGDEKIACDRLVFEEDERTIVQEWDITCLENQWKLSLVGSVHFAGIIVGSAVFGILADKYGRKLIFVFCIMLMSVSGVAQVISPNYITFLVFIFLNALGTSGIFPLAFIIGVELVGIKKREVTGIGLNYFYAVGEALVALFAWLSKDWVILQLIVSAPAALFIFYYWLIPESVRWLLAKQKTRQAITVIKQATRVNGTVLSASTVASLESNLVENKENLKRNCQSKKEIWPVIKSMISSRKIILRFSAVYFIWASNAFIYYGLSLNSTSMSGNKYWNFALVCLIEIPGYTVAWIGIRIFGRRFSLAGSLFLCALTCGLVGFVRQSATWIVITLFLIGKLGVTSAFGVVYVHTAEMLPTIIRSGGVGLASTIARFGALVAPFVPLLGMYVESLPMILFAVVSFVAGILALYLPETLGIKLPETVEEAKKL